MNLDRGIKIARLIVLLLLAACLVAVTITVLQLDSEMLEISQRVRTLLDGVNVLSENVDDRVNELHSVVVRADSVLLHAMPVEDAVLARVNELQPEIAKAGAVEDAALARVNEFKAPIDETRKLLFDARGSVAEMNHAALAERKYFEVQVPETTEKLNAAIEGFQPVEENAAKLLGSAAAISDDGRKVADKETADFLKPVPWYMKPVKRFGEIWDIAAAAARHVP